MSEITQGYDVDDLDETILDFLQEGRTPQSLMIQRTDYSKNEIFNRLKLLRRLNMVVNVHQTTATYQLIEDPRSTDRIRDSMASRDFLLSQTDDIPPDIRKIDDPDVWREVIESSDSDSSSTSSKSHNNNNGTGNNKDQET